MTPPFRDDDIAEKARATALERERDELRATLASLTDTVRALEIRAAPAVVRALRSRLAWVAFVIGFGAALAAVRSSEPLYRAYTCVVDR